METFELVAKRTRKFPLKYTQVTKEKQADLSCISLANNTLVDITQLALTWVGWTNGEKLALTLIPTGDDLGSLFHRRSVT